MHNVVLILPMSFSFPVALYNAKWRLSNASLGVTWCCALLLHRITEVCSVCLSLTFVSRSQRLEESHVISITLIHFHPRCWCAEAPWTGSCSPIVRSRRKAKPKNLDNSLLNRICGSFLTAKRQIKMANRSRGLRSWSADSQSLLYMYVDCTTGFSYTILLRISSLLTAGNKTHCDPKTRSREVCSQMPRYLFALLDRLCILCWEKPDSW
jgi:hypothetical protein